MNDNCGRNIRYLRLSVTDLCNLRCAYCMPAEGVEKLSHGEILSVEEIGEIVAAAAECGIEKVRITGGEPLVRRGIMEICRLCASTRGIKEVVLTTNGVRLAEWAGQLREAGVSRVNISLDTLKAGKYKEITRLGSIDDVFRGMDAAKAAGFEKLKLNAVLIGGFNDDEIPDFVALTRDEDIEVRFIELMPIGECAGWDKSRFIASDAVLKAVPELEPAGASGVARLYKVRGHKGSVGLISPISSHFCSVCDRIRVTADGRLKPCLHSAEEIKLKGLHGEELKAAVEAAIKSKPKGHRLNQAASESARSMFRIGG